MFDKVIIKLIGGESDKLIEARLILSLTIKFY